MKRRSLLFLPLIVSLLMGIIGMPSCCILSCLHIRTARQRQPRSIISYQRSAPATTAQGVARMGKGDQTTLLSYQIRTQRADASQIDAAQCYADQELQTVRTQSVAAGTGRMVFSLDACPGQQALFGAFRLLDTGQPLTEDSCAYIQNDLIGQNQGMFAGDCSGQFDPGTLQTAPRPNDGQRWQACWIDYSVPLPQPACTAFEQVVEGAPTQA